MELVTVAVRFRAGNIPFRYYGLMTIGARKRALCVFFFFNFLVENIRELPTRSF